MYHVLLTNSIINISRTVSIYSFEVHQSSICHELCHLYVTNCIYIFSQSVSIICLSRSLSSVYHELCPLNIKKSILSCTCHEVYLFILSKCINHLYVTNSVIYMSRTVSIYSLEVCHILLTNSIIYISRIRHPYVIMRLSHPMMSRTLSFICHELYLVSSICDHETLSSNDVTNSVIYISRTVSCIIYM